ncbi:lactadherin-like [Branchiostoma floridae x Branchiostoma belcheri]
MCGTNVVFLRVLFCVIAITCAWLVTAEQVCTYPLGMESGAIPDASITASSISVGFESYHGRLNGVAGVGAWAARTNTIGEWLQVDLGEMKTVTGTIIQGRSSADQWVTSYKLQYSLDGLNWITYASSDGSEEVFPGNTDRNTPVTNLLDSPTDARYVRFLPQSWDDWMSMRVEVLGCSVNVCTYPLGMESGAIPDASITASSISDGFEPYHCRLNGVAGVGAWAARTNTIGEWLQVDLGEMKTVTGTIIQGRSSADQWVTSYKLQYSLDGLNWITYASSDGPEEVFPGNTDRNTPVTNLLDSPTDARYVRFLPQSWDDWMSMRVEVLGCSVNAFIYTTPPPTTTTAVTTTTAATSTVDSSTAGAATTPTTVTTPPPTTTTALTTTTAATSTVGSSTAGAATTPTTEAVDPQRSMRT